MKKLLKTVTTLFVLTLITCLFPLQAHATEEKEIGGVDIASITKYTEQDGWSWDPETKILTLAGVNMFGYTPYSYTENPDNVGKTPSSLFTLPYGSTVYVKEGTVNVLQSKISGGCFTVKDLDKSGDSGITFTGGGTLHMWLSEICIYANTSIYFKDTNLIFENADIPVMSLTQPVYDDNGNKINELATNIEFDNVNLTVKNCTGGIYTYGDYSDSGIIDNITPPTSSVHIKNSTFDMEVVLDKGNERNHHCFLIRNGDLTVESSSLKLNAYHPAAIVWRQFPAGTAAQPLIKLTDCTLTDTIEIGKASTDIENSVVHAETFVNKGNTTSISFGTGYSSLSFDHVMENALTNAIINGSPKYVVTFDTQGGTSCDSITVEKGAAIDTLPTSSKDDFSFVGWATTKDATDANVTTDTLITTNTTLYAVWKEIPKYTITFDSQGGTSCEKIIVKENQKIGTLPTSTKTDFTFGGWATTKDALQADITVDTVVTKDMTLYAIWKAMDTTNTPDTNTPDTNVPSTEVITEEMMDSEILNLNTDKKDVSNSNINKLMLKATGKNKSIKLTWKKVSGATSYVIYGSTCGKNMKKLKTVKASKKSYTFKKLKKGTYYKYIVVAYQKVNDTNIAIATSKSVHSTTKGGKYGNPTSIKSVKSSITLKTKKTKKLKPTLKFNKKINTHIAKFRYESSNKSIATVSKKGVVKGIQQGTAYIYIYAQNGVCKKVKITVKK